MAVIVPHVALKGGDAMIFSDTERIIHERTMEEVHGHLEYVISHLEQLSIELCDVEMSYEEWKVLDDLLSKVFVRLDMIN